MFNDLLDQPRRELEELRAKVDVRDVEIDSLKLKCAAQEKRIACLEMMHSTKNDALQAKLRVLELLQSIKCNTIRGNITDGSKYVVDHPKRVTKEHLDSRFLDGVMCGCSSGNCHSKFELDFLFDPIQIYIFRKTALTSEDSRDSWKEMEPLLIRKKTLRVYTTTFHEDTYCFHPPPDCDFFVFK